MAENMYIQLAQNNAENTQTHATTHVVNNSRDWHDTIGEGLKVTATGIGVVFAVLVIMIIFINVIKAAEPAIEKLLKSVRGTLGTKGADDISHDSVNDQNIDNTTLVLISAAVAAYTHNKAKIRRVRVLPAKAKQGGNWAMQARSALQSSHSKKY